MRSMLTLSHWQVSFSESLFQGLTTIEHIGNINLKWFFILLNRLQQNIKSYLAGMPYKPLCVCGLSPIDEWILQFNKIWMGQRCWSHSASFPLIVTRTGTSNLHTVLSHNTLFWLWVIYCNIQLIDIKNITQWIKESNIELSTTIRYDCVRESIPTNETKNANTHPSMCPLRSKGNQFSITSKNISYDQQHMPVCSCSLTKIGEQIHMMYSHKWPIWHRIGFHFGKSRRWTLVQVTFTYLIINRLLHTLVIIFETCRLKRMLFTRMITRCHEQNVNLWNQRIRNNDMSYLLVWP